MTAVPEPSAELLQRAAAVRLAAVDLGQTDDAQRAAALQAMADALEDKAAAIVAANREDLERSAAEGLAPALMRRLKLDAGPRSRDCARWRPWRIRLDGGSFIVNWIRVLCWSASPFRWEWWASSSRPDRMP